MKAPHPILSEQVQTLYRQSTSTFVGTLVAATIATFVLYPSGPSQQFTAGMVFVWLGCVVALTGVRFYLVRRYFNAVSRTANQQLDASGTQRAARAFAIGSLVSGCLWGTLGVMAFDSNAYVPTLFLALLLGGMVSGALGSLSVYYPAFVAYSLPSVLPFAYCSLSDGSREFAGFGLLAVVFMLVCLGYGRGLNRSLRRSIELRFENAQLMRDLEAARDRAELASSNKTALLVEATHDLRQPAYAAALFVGGLRAVLTSAFAGKEWVGNPAAHQAQRLLGQLEASVTAFNALLEAQLDLAQLDAGAPALVPVSVNVRQVLDSVANMLAASATQRQMTLRVHANEALWITAPPDAVQRIVLNLTSNAIKFSCGQKVLLFARLQQGQVRIGVADAGPGIAKSDQLRLFDAFVRLPQNRDDAGLGLGLAIVKRLAKQTGALVSLVSATGHSSIFSVSLPRSAAPTVLACGVQSHDGALPDVTGWLALVLDEDALARSATTSAVQALGLAVQPLATAQGAYDWLAQHTSSGGAVQQKFILITDLHLGDSYGRDGLSILAAYRQNLPCIKGLMVTGETAPVQLQRVAQSGMHVVRKPCQPHALESALRGLLVS